MCDITAECRSLSTYDYSCTFSLTLHYAKCKTGKSNFVAECNLKRRSNTFLFPLKGSAKTLHEAWVTEYITVPSYHAYIYLLFFRFTHPIKSASIFHATEIEFCLNRVNSCQISSDVLFQIKATRVNLHWVCLMS